MTEITLTLPIPPSANRYWQYIGRRVITSPEAAHYKNAVRMTLRTPKIAGRVALNISVYRPRKAGDLDNYLKVLLDSLQGVLYDNDAQITEIHAFRYDDPANPRVHLVAWQEDI